MKHLVWTLAPLLLLSSCDAPTSRNQLENPDLALELIQGQSETISTLFFQMSDTQFGLLTKYLSRYSLGIIPEDFIFPIETNNFETAISFANQSKPAFAVICGDLVHGPIHQAQTNEFKRIADQLDSSIPLYIVSGNHDVGSYPTPESLQQHRIVYGPDWYSFDEGNVIGIVLNSSLIRNPEGAPEEATKQRQWLEDELKRIRVKEGSEKSIFVFQHHPFFQEHINENFEEGLTVESEKRKDYMALFSKYNVSAVLAGHLHGNSEAKYENVQMITTSAIGIASPYMKSRTGLRVIEAGIKDFQHAFISIDDISKNIVEKSNNKM